jgi:GWxTD domain-containing protein
MQNTGEVVYELVPDAATRTGLFVPIGTETLPLRRFHLALTIVLGDQRFSAEKSFMMVWPEMPFSLRNVEYAIQALKYITTEDQRDSLERGNFEERLNKLETFWRSKDRTAGTEYNEVMVEYYRRVDHASLTFGTLREPDGFRSDRGRIYILHGPPTRVDRKLSPSGENQEIWTYAGIDKTFIFTDQTKNGNYVLGSTR